MNLQSQAPIALGNSGSFFFNSKIQIEKEEL